MSDIEDQLKFLEYPEEYFIEIMDDQGSVCQIKYEDDFLCLFKRKTEFLIN